MKKFYMEAPTTLEEILRRYFGSEKPFLKKKQVDYIDDDGEKHYRHLTVSGNDAYNCLVDVLYGLQNIGIIDNANEAIERLDALVSEEY